MKNSTIVGLVVAVVLIGGGYMVWRSSSNPASDEANTALEGEQQQMLAGTFAALVRNGNDVECSFTQGQGTTTTSGKIYITDRGERIRGDFMMSEDGKPTEAHMIRVDNWNYVWGSAMPQGVKMAVTAENREKLFEGENGGIPDDVEYNCGAWQADAAAFNVPNDIKFMDMSAMMGTTTTRGADTKAMQCGACEQAGPAKEQCLAALGCKAD